MQEMKFRIDWLAFTVHAVDEVAEYIWDRFFREHLGMLQDKGHGGRGYKRIREAEQGAKVYLGAVNDLAHFHIELPGKASGCLPSEMLAGLFEWLDEIENGSDGRIKFSVKRLDLAFDNIPFTPDMFKRAIEENCIRSLTQRNSLVYINKPFVEREDGSGEGQETVYFGSPQSSRRVRVYNMRGPVRFEFVTKAERSDKVSRSLFLKDSALWPQIAIGHIRDFMDIYTDHTRTEFAPWWLEFVQDAERARMTVHSSKDVNEMRVKSWMEEQVAKWLFVMETKYPEWLEKIKREASKNLKPHHKRILGESNE